MGERGPALSKGERTRRRIVGHAAELIYAKGYGKTTIDEVIEAAGVTKGSFYFHFSCKDELGCAVIDYASSYILERLKQALDHPELTPYGHIEAMLHEIQGMVEAADCSRGCILGNLALETSYTNDGFRERIAQAFRSWSGLIASELEEMKKAGELPPDFDSSSYAEFVLSSLEGGIMMSKVALDPKPMRNSVALILRQIQGMIGSAGGGAAPQVGPGPIEGEKAGPRRKSLKARR